MVPALAGQGDLSVGSVADGWCCADVAIVVDLGGGEGCDVGAGDAEAQLVGAVEAVPDGPLGRAVLRLQEPDDGPVEPGAHDDLAHADELVVGAAQEGLGHERGQPGLPGRLLPRDEHAGGAVADVAAYAVPLHRLDYGADALEEGQPGGLAVQAGAEG